MTKAKRVLKAPALPPSDPMEVLAREFFELDQWRRSTETAAKLKRHEDARKLLQTAWKQSGRNAPWLGDGWQVFFVQQPGKSFTRPCDGCQGVADRRDSEYHIKAQVMVQPDAA